MEKIEKIVKKELIENYTEYFKEQTFTEKNWATNTHRFKQKYEDLVLVIFVIKEKIRAIL